jgi:hypothetical protein
MSTNDPSDIVPIDPAVREVLEEFSHDPTALANEIVTLRQELQARPHSGPPTVIIKQPPPPPDAPQPTRCEPYEP